MAARLIVVAVGLVALVAGRPARADIFECSLDGKIWITNHKPPGAKCHIVVKELGSPQVAGTASGSGEGAVTRREGSWKPPRRKVEHDDAAPSAGGGSQPGKEQEIGRIVAEAARRYGLPEPFIHAVITVESSYKLRALSYKGAMGLMQLMPGTAADMGVSDPYDAYENIMGGSRFLRLLANRFDGDIPKVLAAFHAGGHAVARAEGIPYQGSDGYVRKVLDNYYRLKQEMAVEEQPRSDR